MATLPKHLRPRWRYLAVVIETAPGTPIDRDAIQGACWRAVRSLLGDVASARIDAEVMRFEHDGRHGEALVRVRRGEETSARAALATIVDLDGRAARIEVRGVSGTIRACSETFLGIPREADSQEVVAFEGEESRAHLAGEVVDIERDSTMVGATTLDLI